MTNERRSIDSVTGRLHDVRRYRSSDELVKDVAWPEYRFVCLLAWDAQASSTESVFAVAKHLIQNGCVYVCTWGPDCERVHDQFDEEDFSLHEEGPWIMSTWHAKEPLSEAIWFALNCTWPDEAFEDECKEVIGIAIANDSWADEIHEAFMRRQELEPLTPRDSSGSIQVDERFGRRYLLRNCALAIPPGMAFALLWLRGMKTDLKTWLLLGFFVVWIAGWMLADFFYFRRYRCPACGGVVRKPSIAKRKPGDPIRYKCIPCDTEWDTRLRESGEL